MNSLINVNVPLSELKAIREALQELVTLLRGKLLADGYFRGSEPRKTSTEQDVSIVTEGRVWEQKQQQERAEKRRMEQVEPPEGDLV